MAHAKHRRYSLQSWHGTGNNLTTINSSFQPTYEADNLLVLDLFGVVDALASEGWVLLRVAGGQGVDGRQHDAHEVRIVWQSINGLQPADVVMSTCQ